MGSYQGPVTYYWPAAYRRQPVWYVYPSYSYQTPYYTFIDQTAYPTQTGETAYVQQAVERSVPTPDGKAEGRVTPASYEATEAPRAAEEAAAPAGDPYGFTAWLNATRAAYGLPAVGYDPSLASWAAMNNQHQASYGIGHFVFGPGRRQNSAMGAFPGIESMWMASPAHAAALLDPTIRWIGIAGLGAYWTFLAY